MIESRDAAPVRDQVALGALSRVFLQVSLCGFGGGLALAHRIVVDERQWLTEPEFADIVSLCQFLPGPNIIGIAVCTGTRLRGAAGATRRGRGFSRHTLGTWISGGPAASRPCAASLAAEHSRWAVGNGRRAPDCDRHPPVAAASEAPGRARLRCPGVRPCDLRQAAAPDRALRACADQHRRGRCSNGAGAMSGPAALLILVAHLALLSSISFGGFPTVLPDVRQLVVDTHGWMTNQEFANFFATSQALPGPNMILMMSFVGWKVWGFPGAAAAAGATFGPPCVIYYGAYRLWHRFRHAGWQPIVRRGLVPVVTGLVIASGIVMARAADADWQAAAMTVAAAVLMLATRINPLWLLFAGGALGGLGLL